MIFLIEKKWIDLFSIFEKRNLNIQTATIWQSAKDKAFELNAFSLCELRLC